MYFINCNKDTLLLFIYRHIVGRNRVRLATMLRRVATCLGVVGSSLKMVKFEPTTPNMSQHVATGGQTHATCCDRLAGALHNNQSPSSHLTDPRRMHRT